MNSTPAVPLIILPVLNEVTNLRTLFDEVYAVIGRSPFKFLIIDDGSTDGTLDTARDLCARYPEIVHLVARKKAGRGSMRGKALYDGVRWGIENTACDIFIEMDGDLSHRPVELKTGIHHIFDEGYDVAIASKFMPGGQVVNRPWGRNLVSLCSSYLVRMLITCRIRDYSNGYRFYSRAAAEMILAHQIQHLSPIYLTEVLAIWLRGCMRVMEFPSIYIGRGEGVSKLRYRDLAKALGAVFSITWRYRVSGFQRRTA